MFSEVESLSVTLGPMDQFFLFIGTTESINSNESL